MQPNYSITTILEPLTDNDLSILQQKIDEYHKTFIKAYKIICMVIFAIILISVYIAINEPITEYYTIDDHRETVEFCLYFTIIGTISTLLVCFIHYRLSLSPYLYDKKKNIKHVEYAVIRQKQYAKQQNTYYFRIVSNYKIHIKVEKETFQTYAVGDQITIEYLPKSKVYFGYY